MGVKNNYHTKVIIPPPPHLSRFLDLSLVLHQAASVHEDLDILDLTRSGKKAEELSINTTRRNIEFLLRNFFSSQLSCYLSELTTCHTITRSISHVRESRYIRLRGLQYIKLAKYHDIIIKLNITIYKVKYH